ncbi:MAG: hypothetical protein JWO34_1473, partial [Arthrobacter sp.]|nr:hypothetical protein [Arthrobacter sp.]
MGNRRVVRPSCSLGLLLLLPEQSAQQTAEAALVTLPLFRLVLREVHLYKLTRPRRAADGLALWLALGHGLRNRLRVQPAVQAGVGSQLPVRRLAAAEQTAQQVAQTALSSASGSTARTAQDPAQNSAEVNAAGLTGPLSAARAGRLPTSAEDLVGKVGHHDGRQDRKELPDEIPARPAQLRGAGQLACHLVLLPAEDVAD